MVTRILAAIVLVAVLVVAAFFLPEIVFAVLFAAMAAVAAYELLNRTGLVKQPRLVAYSCVAAFLVPLWCYWGMSYALGLIGVLAFTAVLFGEMLASSGKLPFFRIAYCYVAGLLIPFLLSSIMRIRNGENGIYVVAIPFVLAFLSDTGAYFAGRFFGKHKLAPIISPKKTVEGVVGGVLAAILGMIIYGVIMQLGFQKEVNYIYAAIYGFLGSFAAVFGDLCFSVVKRQTGIKDYGNLIPGHGGILDRFDSMMIVGPLAEALLLLLPVLV